MVERARRAAAEQAQCVPSERAGAFGPVLGCGHEFVAVVHKLAPTMKGNTTGRMAMVEPGNAPDPLGRDRVRLYTYMVICSGAGVVVILVGSGMVFAIDDQRRRLDGEVDRGLGGRQCPSPPSTTAEPNANRPNGEDLLRRLELLGVGDRLMPAKQSGVSSAYLKVMCGYDAASENAFEEHLYHRASVHRADRSIVVVTAPGVSEGRVTLCLFGVRFGRPS